MNELMIFTLAITGMTLILAGLGMGGRTATHKPQKLKTNSRIRIYVNRRFEGYI